MKDVDHHRDAREPSDRHDAEILTVLGNPGQAPRPFSLPDLIRLGTLDLELAAWLMAHISRGASYIIGAGPGGVGKTTTMRALLSFVPVSLPLAIALPGQVSAADGSACCIISHELSGHPPPAYLWNQDLRDFFALSEQGHMLVGNMHADNLDEVHAQISGANDVPEPHFRAINLFVFIRIEGQDPSARRIDNPQARRFINEIFYSDGAAPHESVFTCGNGLSACAPRDVTCEARCRAFLEEIMAGPSRTVEETRRLFVAWEDRHSRASF